MDKKNLTIEETFALAVKNQQKNNLHVAEKLYREVININPSHVDANNNLGIILLRSRKIQEAINYFEKTIENKSNHASAHNNLGVAFRQLKNYQRAMVYYEKAIKIEPSHASAHDNLGEVFRLLGELQKARSCHEKAIQINPKNGNAHSNLGEVFRLLGEFQKARDCHEKAIEINPKNTESYNSLGTIMNELGDQQKAISCYEKTIEIQPNHSNAHNNLGNIFRKLKKFQKAADYFVQSATIYGNAQFLECTYLASGVKPYSELLDTFAKKDPTNLRIAALASYVSTKENIKNVYPFCKNPLNYFFSVNLKNEFESSNQLSERLLKTSDKLDTSWQVKNLVKNGQQSTGNLLNKSFFEIIELKKKIEKQISIYRNNFKNSNDYFITKWPTICSLTGWYIKLKKQGQLKSHIHETGWLSGVLYLKIPKLLKKNEGSINLSLQGFDYPYDKNLPNLYFSPKPFDLILYPSSLFHYTVPFDSDEERHCIAFDLTPKRN
tara:strand:- start:578 stop:2062 length:1485 start_codon:yes stop_codon:yes gene_type:complete